MNNDEIVSNGMNDDNVATNGMSNDNLVSNEMNENDVDMTEMSYGRSLSDNVPKYSKNPISFPYTIFRFPEFCSANSRISHDHVYYRFVPPLDFTLRWFFGLTHLPPAKVEDGFLELMNAAPGPFSVYSDFLNYLLANYIDQNSRYPPVLWASEPSFCPRTTNGVESFHAHFNQMFYRAHPNIHQVVSSILEVQMETDLKINSISCGQWKSMCSKTLTKYQHIQEKYGAYRRGDISRL